ncbi:hypothetical protein [Enterovibrio norvegicus]|uniref:Uncharacterized protein n=1 Tax=Enterovibrio norvegicus DSM 15893 TaxID=1121869 RepID=A0A1I5T4M4_9GAMM|nr:hypothetical protein [Enterovibrio norvegicus]SFP78002.1 hypothetical protein SAMN03084138_03093 [Enterovibrio norvegicus DSM 15893]
MFDLICHIEGGRSYPSQAITLIESGFCFGKRFQIPESASLSFSFIIKDKNLDRGSPILNIGDIPVKLRLDSKDDASSTWISTFKKPFSNYESAYDNIFFNNAGNTVISIEFTNSSICKKLNIDVLASKENEALCQEMLGYMSSKFDDVINLCFSRTLKGTGNDDQSKECNISKLISEAERGISTIESLWPFFSRNIRSVPERNIAIQRGGIPDSPEGLIWLSQNQSNIIFCDINEQTVRINNLPAKIFDSAVEKIKQNTNIKENLVILSYLSQIQKNF